VNGTFETSLFSDDPDATIISFTYDGVYYTATRHRVAAPVPIKTRDLTNDGSDGEHPFISQNEVQHQQLAPVYSQTPTFSDEWTYEGFGEGLTVIIRSPEFHEASGSVPAHWDMEISDGTQGFVLEDYNSGETASTLHFGGSGAITATRVRTDIIGYTLGSQTTKPLQPQGDYLTQHQSLAGLMPMYALGAEPTVKQSVSVLASCFPMVLTIYPSEDTVTITSEDADGLSVAWNAGYTAYEASYNGLIVFTADSSGVVDEVDGTFNGSPAVSGSTQVLNIRDILTVAPYTSSTYTATSTAAAFEIAVGALPTGVMGKLRDCILVIDCTATGAVAPSVTWDTHFHPRTDTATDLAIVEAGKRAVFYISEYVTGEFAVGGWVETEGGGGSGS
jgi:hypothetical protein